jgi:hypothetical protein
VMLPLVEAVGTTAQPLAARRLAVDGHVLARRLGKSDVGLPVLEQLYRALLREPGGDRDAVLLNNLAVLVAEQGRTDEAQRLWAQAIEHAEEDARGMPRLNALAARASAAIKTPLAEGDVEGSAARKAERAELVELATSGSAVEVRLQAHAWLAAIAATPAERRKAERALREAAAKVAATNYRPRNLPGRGGVILRASVQMGLGYSTVEGLQIQLDSSGVPWLVLPCPVVIPEARGKAE